MGDLGPEVFVEKARVAPGEAERWSSEGPGGGRTVSSRTTHLSKQR